MFLTPKQLMERWQVSYDYLAYLRCKKSRPIFLKIGGIRYPLKEIEDIEKNCIKLPTKEEK